MKTLFASIFVLLISGYASAADYSTCVDRLKSSNYEAELSSYIKLGYDIYGNLSDSIEDIADLSDVKVCTDTSYGLVKRTTKFFAVGTVEEITDFKDRLVSFAERYNN